MNPMTRHRLYLFRHGETDWNAQHRIQGHTDIALNLHGRRQAHKLAARLQAYPIEALLSSDLARARETGAIVAGRLGIPLYVDRRLREACLGDVEGMTVEEAIARFGETAWRTWCSCSPDDWHFHFPNGEHKQQTLQRARAGLEDFLKEVSYRNIAISTHGGVIRTLVSSVRESTEPVAIPNCSVHILEREEDSGGSAWRHCTELIEPDSPAGLPPPEF
jgi:probable phosphoglycerate mutase